MVVWVRLRKLKIAVRLESWVLPSLAELPKVSKGMSTAVRTAELEEK